MNSKEKMLQLSEDALEFAKDYNNLKSRIVKRLKDNFLNKYVITIDGFGCIIKEDGIKVDERIMKYELYSYIQLMYLLNQLVEQSYLI
jgi:hypothetical protein